MMTKHLLLAATVAVGCAVAGSGCCGMYPYGICGMGCGDAGCGMGRCSPQQPGCDSGVGSACDGGCGVDGSGGVCDTCGLGECADATIHGFLWHARLAIRNLLTCGSGCGDLYIDEWHSDPPDLHDPCIDCAQTSTAPCGCGNYQSVPLRFWGRRFHEPGCSTCAGASTVESSELVSP